MKKTLIIYSLMVFMLTACSAPISYYRHQKKIDKIEKMRQNHQSRSRQTKMRIEKKYAKRHQTTQPAPPTTTATTTIYTPAIGDTFAKVVKNLGEPDDEFLLKDEDGGPDPNTNIVWYFEVKNDQLTRVLMMYIRDNAVSMIEERTSDKAPGTIGFYKSYLVICATMAHRPPRFAFALNSPPNIN